MGVAGVSGRAVAQDRPAGRPASRQSGRSVGLDVVRALAALGVLVTHVAFATGVVNPERFSSPLRHLLPRLDVGVTVFFVLSGLLVGRPFVRRHLAAAPLPALRPYARRRAGRIYPAYLVVLAVTLITVGRPGWVETLTDVLLVHIYVPRFAIGPITQSWTLATEISFYAFLPLWFLLNGRLADRRGAGRAERVRWLAAGLAGWVVVAAVWRAGVVALTDTFDLDAVGAIDTRGALLTWLPNHLDAFAIGVGLALWLETGRARRLGAAARLGCYAGAMAALWLASTALDLPPVFTGFDGPQTFGRHLLFLVVAAGVVAPSALAGAAPAGAAQAGAVPVGAAGAVPVGAAGAADPDGGEEAGVGRRPAAGLAARLAAGAALASYGLYLWHQWVTTQWFEERSLLDFRAPFVTTLVVVVVASAALAGLTYWFVERPSTTLTTGLGGGRPQWPARRLGPQPRLDGLRGAAILAVLATHVVFLDSGSDRWALRGGFLGVDVFLGLSAFLIAAVLLREIDDTTDAGRPSLDRAGFARRRARRLYPPLVVFLAIEGPIAVVLGTPLGEQVRQSVLAVTFTSNWQLSWGHQPPFALVHLWSLAMEAQFYVLMALGLWWARRLLRRPERLVAWLLLGAVAVCLWRMWLHQRGVDLEALYERTDARADSMFLGVAAAVAWRSRLVPDRVLRALGVAGGAVLLWSFTMATPTSGWLFSGGFTVVAASAAAVVAAAATGTGLVAAVGGWAPLRWLGAISYSLYLWHLPIYLWTVRAVPDAPLAVRAAVAVAASVAVGWLSYRLVEVRVLATWRRDERGRGGGPGQPPGPQSTTPSVPASR
jgi:peptidoglycan/LPS O-acetylase OafA/YrhL